MTKPKIVDKGRATAKGGPGDKPLTTSGSSNSTSNAKDSGRAAPVKKRNGAAGPPTFSKPAQAKSFGDASINQLHQDNFLTAAIYSDSAAKRIWESLPVHLFTSPQYREIMSAVYDYVDRYGLAPKEHVADLLADALQREDEHAEMLSRVLTQARQLHESGINEAYVLDQLDAFVRQQTLKIATIEIHDLIQRGDLAAAESAFAKAAEARPLAGNLPKLLDIRQLAATESEPQSFIVEGIVPEHEPTLLTGHGGSVKSWVALIMAVCIAAGRVPTGEYSGIKLSKRLTWFGKLVWRRRRVAYFSYEDNRDELHRRLEKICRHLRISMKSLDGWLHLYDGVRADAVLFQADGRGMSTTAQYDWLKSEIGKHQIEVAFIDGVADVFAGNVNDPSQVKAFVRKMLDALATVILIAHVNKQTAGGQLRTTENYIGTVQWHNAVRSRLYVRAYDEKKKLIKDADSPDDDETPTRHPSFFKVKQEKTNRDEIVQPIWVRWDKEQGLPVYVSSEARAEERESARAEQQARNEDHKAWLLEAVSNAFDSGNPVPVSQTAAPNMMQVVQAMPNCPKGLKDNALVKQLVGELVIEKKITEAKAPGKSRGHPRQIYRPAH